MLETMRTPGGRDDTFFDELSLGFELEADDFEPEMTARLSALTMETDRLVERCRQEIEAALAAGARSGREDDLVGWLAEELRREHLSGLLEGLTRLAAALQHLGEGTPLPDAHLAATGEERERYRLHAVDRIARINDGLLRRQQAKNRRGVEN